MCFFTAGPWYTMSFSSSVRSRNGTSVRTPISRQTSVISDHMRLFHGATAPWSIVRESSGTSVDRSTLRTHPVPPHFWQAPWELNASSSADGAKKRAPHTGHSSSLSAATDMEGSRKWPLGQWWLDSLENMSLRLLRISVPVPKVLRIPGTPGR